MRLPPPEAETDGPNLTPVIDVVFLLLIFFLVATVFDQQEKLVSIKLAEIFKPSPMAAHSKEVIVNVTKKGEFIIVDEKLNESQLADFLHRLKDQDPTNARVQVRADGDVMFRYPLTVIGYCKREELPYSTTVMERKVPL